MTTDGWWAAAPDRPTWRCVPAPASVAAFHASIPGHAATPLHEVPALADELGVGRVYVKEESSRLGLPAFKVLGVSWAIARVLLDRGGGADWAHRGRIRWSDVVAAASSGPATTVATATDGNHGRAVARLASRLGLPARIHVPRAMDDAVVAAIASEGAQVVRVDGSYDRAVAAAADGAGGDPGVVLVQDTAWPGYEVVPGWVVEGYSTLFREVDDQLAARDVGPPTLTVVPIGVGSFAQAAVTHAGSVGAAAGRRRSVLGVEPDTAACVLASLVADAPTTVTTRGTVMAGLDCGTPSSLAWPVLRAGLDAVVAVSDDRATAAVTDLDRRGIDSGPSGAAALAGARRALAGPATGGVRRRLGVDDEAVVVLVSTEGRGGVAP